MNHTETRGASAVRYPVSSRQTDPKAREPEFVIPLALRIKGDLRVDSLREALADVVERQESLRTRLHYPDPAGYTGFMEVLPPLPVELTVVDVAVPASGSRDEMAIELLGALNEQTLPYTVTPSLVATLHRFDGRDAVLTLLTNHLFSDGWSTDLLRREIAASYTARVTGQPNPLPRPTPYREFAAWEQDFLSSERGAAARRFWQRKLDGAEMFKLPADHEHGPDTLPPSGSIGNFAIDADRFAQVTLSASEHRCSAWHVFLAAFMVLAERVTGQTDITLFVSNNGRPTQDFYDTMGFFVNPVPLRLQFGACESFLDLMLVARTATSEARRNQLPFSTILEMAPGLMGGGDARGVGAEGLMPIFNYLSSPSAQDDTRFAASVEQVVMPEELPSNFARGGLIWDFMVIPPGEFRCCIEYESDGLDPSTVDGWAAVFVDYILAITAHPHQPWKQS